MKVFKTILLALMLICNAFLFSCDTPESLEDLHNQVFIRLYGGIESEEAYDFIQLEDGGYMIVGSTTSYGSGDMDVFLVRTDENGIELWSKNYGTTENDEMGKSILLGEDNNSVIICGETRSVSSPQNSSDILLLKTDLEGNELAMTIVGENNRDEYGQQVIQAIEGGGYAVLGNNVDSALYLFEVDHDLIMKEGLGSDNYGIQGAKNIGRNVMIHEGFYLCYGTVQEPDSSSNYFMYLIDINSNSISTIKQFGGGQDDIAIDMTRVAGGYLLTGYQINGSRHNPFYFKVRNNFSNSNSIIWNRRFEFGTNTEPRAVVETNDGGYIVLQRSLISPFGNEIGLLKLNINGSEQWRTTFGSQNNDLQKGGNISQLNDDYFVLCGTIRFDEKNNDDVYKMSLIKANPFGELEPLSD